MVNKLSVNKCCNLLNSYSLLVTVSTYESMQRYHCLLYLHIVMVMFVHLLS